MSNSVFGPKTDEPIYSMRDVEQLKAQAIAAEREGCAKTAEELLQRLGEPGTGAVVAAMIRKRGEL